MTSENKGLADDICLGTGEMVTSNMEYGQEFGSKRLFGDRGKSHRQYWAGIGASNSEDMLHYEKSGGIL